MITFNDHPTLAVKFTRDIKALAGGLAGLKAERGTALYDSLIFSFYTFNGLKGRRALLLLSDGKDEGSRFSFEEALEFARRAGVTVYAIGLGDDVDKRKLASISEETGGRAFFPREAGELAGIYAAIQEELRSQVADRLPVRPAPATTPDSASSTSRSTGRDGGEDDPGVLPVKWLPVALRGLRSHPLLLLPAPPPAAGRGESVKHFSVLLL